MVRLSWIILDQVTENTAHIWWILVYRRTSYLTFIFGSTEFIRKKYFPTSIDRLFFFHFNIFICLSSAPVYWRVLILQNNVKVHEGTFRLTPSSGLKSWRSKLTDSDLVFCGSGRKMIREGQGERQLQLDVDTAIPSWLMDCHVNPSSSPAPSGPTLIGDFKNSSLILTSWSRAWWKEHGDFTMSH